MYIYIYILWCFPLHPLMYLSILSLASTASITSMAFFSIVLGTSYFCKKEPPIMGPTLLQLSFVDILLSSTIPMGKKDRKTYGGPSILSSQCISSRGRIRWCFLWVPAPNSGDVPTSEIAGDLSPRPCMLWAAIWFCRSKRVRCDGCV